MIKILELFSGYGGASFALKKTGIEHRCVGYSDIEDCANFSQLFRGNKNKQKCFGDFL
jgi:site-specific DNA-cytosine methylase